MNTTFKEQLLPSAWKHADVRPKEKQPVKDFQKHLRPTSLTPRISKEEELVVRDYVKPATLQALNEHR